jgi:uncharacterized protein (TIGR03435 family)
MRNLALLILIALTAAVAAVDGQAPSFDVASVKVNTSGEPVARITAPAGTGRFDAINAPLRLLILNAYRIAEFQLTGGPSWIDSIRIDIAARTAETATRDDIERMLRTLLADRFRLVIRRETREVPTYALVVARDDGRLGPRMQPSTTDCTAQAAVGRGAAPPPPASGQLLCGTRMSPASINAGGMTMPRLATTLTGIIGRLVTDDTRLTGTYDLQLAFTPEQPLPNSPSPADSDAPSIFTAVQEQLGLKLNASRGRGDVVVIEAIEQPTPD